MSNLNCEKSFLLRKGGKVEICNFYPKSTFSQKWKSRKVRGNIRISMLFMSLQPSYFMFYLVVIKILGKIKKPFLLCLAGQGMTSTISTTK